MEGKAIYLHTVCYLLHKHGSDKMARNMDRVLCTPQMDKFLCQELLAQGCLEPGESRQQEKAIKVLELYEHLARGDKDGEGCD